MESLLTSFMNPVIDNEMVMVSFYVFNNANNFPVLKVYIILDALQKD